MVSWEVFYCEAFIIFFIFFSSKGASFAGNLFGYLIEWSEIPLMSSLTFLFESLLEGILFVEPEVFFLKILGLDYFAKSWEVFVAEGILLEALEYMVDSV